MRNVRTNVPRALRALRLRRGWRQEDLGRRAGLSRDAVHRAETPQLRSVTLGSLDRLVSALDAYLVVEIRWRGADLDGLVDRAHAALVAAVVNRLEPAGWLTRIEVSFNHFGDRGRCDVVAWHPAHRVLMVVEVKSRIGDMQDTVGRLDVKTRVGPLIAEQPGLGTPRLVVPALILAEDGANRRLVSRHDTLLRQYGLRGRAALTWIARPSDLASGLLWFESPDSGQGRALRPGRPAGRLRAG